VQNGHQEYARPNGVEGFNLHTRSKFRGERLIRCRRVRLQCARDVVKRDGFFDRRVTGLSRLLV
jgi:hypothetical protein